MDPVTSAQYLTMKDSFSRQGVEIEVAYTPAGDVDYIYAVGRLLAMERGDNVERMQRMLPGMRRADPGEQPGVGDFVVLSIDEAEDGYLTVPEALDLIDERLEENPALDDGEPLVTPVHVVHITKICPGVEPEVPSGYPTQPWPAPSQAGGKGVKIGVSDTGLQPNLDDPVRYPWLAGVTGDQEPIGPILSSGLQRIPKYAGHDLRGRCRQMYGARVHGVCQRSLHYVRRRTGVCDHPEARTAHPGAVTGRRVPFCRYLHPQQLGSAQLQRVP